MDITHIRNQIEELQEALLPVMHETEKTEVMQYETVKEVFSALGTLNLEIKEAESLVPVWNMQINIAIDRRPEETQEQAIERVTTLMAYIEDDFGHVVETIRDWGYAQDPTNDRKWSHPTPNQMRRDREGELQPGSSFGYRE